MSVRKVYNLLMDGRIIASGSYFSVMFSYNAVVAAFSMIPLDLKPCFTISFIPKGGD